ncbi:MAG: CDP-alcohol phosphatidyltransferase family protein [Bacteroidales bacterium]|nr:CDP-alcohol phosphatidyltransferase family protein [Bacteroidales bacterium]
MAGHVADAVRVQTSILNAAEKKVLVWLAQRQPKWMTSDILTFIGTLGAVVIAAGYILSSGNINWLWLSSSGFVINWYGDSLDGTLARVRNHQRPVYGYYIDHTVDAVSEFLIVLGVGLSGLMHLSLALMVLVFYLMLTINVSINAHLKKEFKLTYAKLGPTEFRIIVIIANTLLLLIPGLAEFSHEIVIFGHDIVLRTMDYVGMVILVILAAIYLTAILKDAKEYAKIDPPHKMQ